MSSDRQPPAMTITITGVVEKGARFRVLRNLGLPHASDAYVFEGGPWREREAK